MIRIITMGLGVLFLSLSVLTLCVADQVIFIDVSHFIAADSQFEVDVDGNRWIRETDLTSITGAAFGGPGDNDRDQANPPGAPFLVIRFSEDVKSGESTADGKKWIPWAHMRIRTDKNSFFWQVSSDKTNWKPADNTNVNRWNDDARNSSNVWYWQDNLTGNDGAINADVAVGVNYVRLGVRESEPDPGNPLIDVICFRNDGKIPTDAEALGSAIAVKPAGKLATTWAGLKN